MKKFFINTILLLWLCIFSVPLLAQEILKKEIMLSKYEGTIEFFLSEISKQTGCTFSYIDNSIPLKKNVELKPIRQTVQEILDTLISSLPLQYEVRNTKIILMNKKKESINYIISGVVKDKSTGELLLGAGILVQELETGVTSNGYGFYSITLPAGSYQLVCSYIGYQPFVINVQLTENRKLDLELTPNSTILSEVAVLSENENENITTTGMGIIKPDMRIIKSMPAFLGEVDIIKSIIQLPGVTTVGEAAPGFNVRGGGIDQNLILLDEAPVYNSSHLFGFYSVFNPDAVKDIKLFKSGIPANYGGRLSSVLDITQKEGNNKAFHGSGGISVVDSRIQLEGPLVKNKSSFLISARRSYIDLFLKKMKFTNVNQAYFYDINAKINYSFTQKDKLYLSGYFGKDVFNIGSDVNTSWGNITTTLRWNHLLSDKLFSNITAVYSNYAYSQEQTTGLDAYKGDRAIVSYHIKGDFTWYHSVNHQIDFGISSLLYQLDPGKLQSINNSDVNTIALPNEHAVESAVYVSDDYKISSKFSVNLGLRYSMFQNIGSGDVFVYQSGLPKSIDTITDTMHYSSSQVVKGYGGFEPRIAVNYQLSDNEAIKISYNRTRQYLHFISNTTAATPIDFWKASDRYLTPEVADQIAIGYFKNVHENMFRLSAEVYYKKIANLVDYKNGADLLLNPALDAELLQGLGKAYGLELMVNKAKGKLTGWVGYTYSQTLRLINGATAIEKINNGNWYPANYNQPHKINFVGVYEYNSRWTFSTNFTYNTGRPITYPDGGVSFEGRFLPNYSSRNQSHIPDYNRLDLSATLKGKTKPSRKWEASWTFSLYNVYARHNVYSIYFKDRLATNGTAVSSYPQPTQLSILATIFPSIAYNFKF